MTSDELSTFARKVQTAYESLFKGQDPEVSIMDYEPVKFMLNEESKWGRKHHKQIVSLLGNMHKLGLLQQPASTFIGLGAGTGEFSYYLLKSLFASTPASFVLVDRQSLKYATDKYFKFTASDMTRLKMDLKDLNFANLDVFHHPSRPASDAPNDNRPTKPVIAYSKHLCGIATDLSLRGLMSYVATTPDHNLAGIMIASCCHQLVQPHTFPLPEYLDDLGFSGCDFERLRIVSAWRMSGTEDEQHTGGLDQDCVLVDEHWSGMNLKERERLGYQAKRIIDMGRVKYLEQHGFKAKLIEYIDASSTPENVAIVAWKP
ncbi:hypothetical protein SeMB42_g06103 [Synchytrium endobioticum]|uniref:tRNA:m(4)X modification enzyme TRM13 n=1 Tax=Synchytrium endobioticum TaxID=286115 RepID=A0A507CGF3_9FUNG|nr:hypothetical protein SeMB42_g06103 [Synchytrium endobioticum]